MSIKYNKIHFITLFCLRTIKRRTGSFIWYITPHKMIQNWFKNYPKRVNYPKNYFKLSKLLNSSQFISLTFFYKDMHLISTNPMSFKVKIRWTPTLLTFIFTKFYSHIISVCQVVTKLWSFKNFNIWGKNLRLVFLDI